jgi:putative NADPH-quinone reductase
MTDMRALALDQYPLCCSRFNLLVMAQRIVIIQGHPDPSDERFCRALAEAYATGASEDGLQVKTIGYFGAHGLKSLERSILRLVGIKPIAETLIGMIGTASEAKRQAWLDKLRALGRRGR